MKNWKYCLIPTTALMILDLVFVTPVGPYILIFSPILFGVVVGQFYRDFYPGKKSRSLLLNVLFPILFFMLLGIITWIWTGEGIIKQFLFGLTFTGFYIYLVNYPVLLYVIAPLLFFAYQWAIYRFPINGFLLTVMAIVIGLLSLIIFVVATNISFSEYTLFSAGFIYLILPRAILIFAIGLLIIQNKPSFKWSSYISQLYK